MRAALEVHDRLLVTGPNGGGVALVSGFGIALLRESDATGLGVHSGRVGWCIQGKGPARLREFREGTLRDRRIADDDLDLHDLLADDEGWWVVATNWNAVLRVDDTGVHEHRRFSDAPDSWHLNSIVFHEGELLASVFGRFSATRGYKASPEGAGEVLRVADGRTIVEGLSQPHSLVSDGEFLWLCNSVHGEVLRCKAGEVKNRWSLPGYTRGLALGERYAYVGLSLSRNTGPERLGQQFESAVIAVLDRKSGGVLGYVPLPWREIYDIRILEDAGLAEALMMSQLNQAPSSARDEAVRAEIASSAELSTLLARQHGEVIAAISDEIRNMQATTAAAMQQVGQAEGATALAAAIDARIGERLLEGRDATDAMASAIASLREFFTESHEDIREKLARTIAVEARLSVVHDDLASRASLVESRLLPLGDVLRSVESQLSLQLGEALEARAALQDALAPIAGLRDAFAPLDTRLVELAEAVRRDSETRDAAAQALRVEHAAAMERMASSHARELERLVEVHSEAYRREREALVAILEREQHRFLSERVEAQRLLDSAHESLSKAKADLAVMEAGRIEAERRAESLDVDVDRWRRETESVRRDLAAETATAKEQVRRYMEKESASAANIATLQDRLSQREDELNALRHEVEQLREAAIQLQQVLGSASWRWTRPVRALARLLRGEWGRDSSARLGQVLRDIAMRTPGLSEQARNSIVERSLHLGEGAQAPALLPDEKVAARLHLAQADGPLPDVFVWSVIDWHFRVQRPQHLARALAERGHRVFYISNNFVDDAKPGMHVQPLDDKGRLFQVHLNLAGAPAIYFAMPTAQQVDALHASLASVLGWSCTRSALSLVQHPYWTPLVRSLPDVRVVYDCMDHHAGFNDNSSDILAAERALVADADLVIVTSSWLQDEIGPMARATALVRNAGEYDFFRIAPRDVFRDPDGRKVIGYYGAIAEWFDLDLVRQVAQSFPEALVVLVGNDTAGAKPALSDLPNVRLVGEVPYADLPFWLHGFDVALLPFQVIPLTLATNPVKVYEYLSAGKPVVAVDLPEMTQFEGLVDVASDGPSFIAGVGRALDGPGRREDVDARQAFAAGQTWAHRAKALDDALASIPEPRVSVIVLTFNNLAFTDACLFSIEAYSGYANLEVVVVDNASTDGSREWLRDWASRPSAAGHTRRLILNETNLGFAAGNNVGLAAATGDILVLLNNDTYVTPGWLRGLCNHLRRDPALGLVGPVTNNIGNEAKIEIAYPDMAEMIRLAGAHTRQNAGRRLDIPTVAFFCVALPRKVYERIGGLDEAFGLGFFEDDDYCRRVAGEGWRIACADDVFVHHHLSASFDALKAEKKQALFERNKAIYEAKWGAWKAHRYRGEQES